MLPPPSPFLPLIWPTDTSRAQKLFVQQLIVNDAVGATAQRVLHTFAIEAKHIGQRGLFHGLPLSVGV